MRIAQLKNHNLQHEKKYIIYLSIVSGRFKQNENNSQTGFFLLSIPTILVYNVRLYNIEHTVNACNIYVTCLQIAHGVCAVSPQYQWK